MAVFKCKMCGAALEVQNDITVIECDYCNSKQTLPKLNDERLASMYDRASHFRRNNEFDKAIGIYEKILNEDNTDAEAYWSLVLCNYGIEYVEDPKTHKQIPTVNRVQFTSIYDDANYKSAIEYADIYQRSIYEEEAKAINTIQKGYLAISMNEDPFDVFICYKESDENGRRTKDSVLANDLYHALAQEGIKAFYAPITLEDKLGVAYEPYIFAALNSAKVMVVLGTRPEYFNAVWVKNEWSRYLALIKKDGKKMLVPAYQDMDPYDLPDEFSHLQALDMSKLGFMQDLMRGIKKIIGVDNSQMVVTNQSSAPNEISNTIKRMFLYMEDEEWEYANAYCEKALDLDPENAEAYLGKLMMSLSVNTREKLAYQHQSFESNPWCKKVLRFADSKLTHEIEKYLAIIKDRNSKKELMTRFVEIIRSKQKADSAAIEAEKNYDNAVAVLDSIHKYDLTNKDQNRECQWALEGATLDFRDLSYWYGYKDSAKLHCLCINAINYVEGLYWQLFEDVDDELLKLLMSIKYLWESNGFADSESRLEDLKAKLYAKAEQLLENATNRELNIIEAGLEYFEDESNNLLAKYNEKIYERITNAITEGTEKALVGVCKAFWYDRQCYYIYYDMKLNAWVYKDSEALRKECMTKLYYAAKEHLKSDSSINYCKAIVCLMYCNDHKSDELLKTCISRIRADAGDLIKENTTASLIQAIKYLILCNKNMKHFEYQTLEDCLKKLYDKSKRLMTSSENSDRLLAADGFETLIKAAHEIKEDHIKQTYEILIDKATYDHWVAMHNECVNQLSTSQYKDAISQMYRAKQIVDVAQKSNVGENNIMETIDCFKHLIEVFNEHPEWPDTDKLINECKENIDLLEECVGKDKSYDLAIAILNATERNYHNEEQALNSIKSFNRAIDLFNEIPGFADVDDLIDDCEDNIDFLNKCISNDKIYMEACQLKDKATVESLETAIKLFGSIKGFKDSDSLAGECRNIIPQKWLARAASYMAQGSYKDAKELYKFVSREYGMDTKENIKKCNAAIKGKVGLFFKTIPFMILSVIAAYFFMRNTKPAMVCIFGEGIYLGGKIIILAQEILLLVLLILLLKKTMKNLMQLWRKATIWIIILIIFVFVAYFVFCYSQLPELMITYSSLWV